MTDSLTMTPVAGPVNGTVRPPGSKSLTNRALIVAAMAQGESHLRGVLDSDDTRVMIESLSRLGVGVNHDASAATAVVRGMAAKRPAIDAELWLENSGTSMRFLTAFSTLCEGTIRLDGTARMRERPIGDLVAALVALGADVRCERGNDCPPVLVNARGLAVELRTHCTIDRLNNGGYVNPVRISYDPAKRNWTLDHRALDFLDAEIVLTGEKLTIQDKRRDYGEPRFITYGWLDKRLVAIGWTPRVANGEEAIHVFSMRRANAREEARYKDRLEKS